MHYRFGLRHISTVCLASAACAAAASDLFVSDFAANSVDEFSTGGAFVSNFVASGSGGLSNPLNIRFGPDGNLYVADYDTVKKYNGTTGAFLGNFVAGLSGATDIVFDKVGNAFVADYAANKVYEFSALGAPLNTFSAGISTPEGLAFLPNGDLLVTNTFSGTYRDTVSDVNTTTAAFTTFATGLGEPVGITAGPDGRFYIGNYTYATSYGGTNPDTIQVVGAGGGVSQTWNVGGNLDGTSYLAFDEGNLFVTSYYNGQIVEFDGTTGAYVGSFNGINQPSGIAVRPQAVPELGSLTPMLAGIGLTCLLGRRRRISDTA